MIQPAMHHVTASAQRLARLYGEDFLDDLIHDLHDSIGVEALNALADAEADEGADARLDASSRNASDINNQGVEGQAAWLYKALGECEALRAIEGAAREHDQQLKAVLQKGLAASAAAGQGA